MVALLHPQTQQPAPARQRPGAEQQHPDGARHLTLVPGSRQHKHGEAVSDGSFGSWLTQLDRRVVAALGAVVLAYVLLSLVQGGPPANAGVGPTEVASVADVQAGESVIVAVGGDTYWEIAATLVADGDIRPVVQQLIDRNGGADLQVGQRVIIPAELG